MSTIEGLEALIIISDNLGVVIGVVIGAVIILIILRLIIFNKEKKEKWNN